MSRQLSIALSLVAGLFVMPVPAHAQGTEPDGPTYQMPTAGSCLLVSMADYRDLVPKTPVDCATEHTVVVTATAVLPEDTDWTIGSDDLAAAEDQYCMPAFYETLGNAFKVIAKTAYLWRYTIPNEEQRSHGASWIRCDLNMSGALAYLPLPHPLLVGNEVPRSIRACLVVLSIGTFSSACSDGHNYEIEKVLTIPGDTYPTVKAARKFGKENCPSAKKRKPYRALWSWEPAWAYGDHTMRCYKAV